MFILSAVAKQYSSHFTYCNILIIRLHIYSEMILKLLTVALLISSSSAYFITVDANEVRIFNFQWHKNI